MIVTYMLTDKEKEILHLINNRRDGLSVVSLTYKRIHKCPEFSTLRDNLLIQSHAPHGGFFHYYTTKQGQDAAKQNPL